LDVINVGIEHVEIIPNIPKDRVKVLRVSEPRCFCGRKYGTFQGSPHEIEDDHAVSGISPTGYRAHIARTKEFRGERRVVTG
jgi:hypothetical protein